MTDQKPRPVLLIVAITFVMALVVAWWSDVFEGAEVPAPPASSSEEVDALSGEAAQSPETPSAATSRRGEQLAPTTEQEADIEAWTAAGRCVDETGSPLADVTIRANIGEAGAPTADEVVVTSGEDGRFALECEVDGQRDGELRVEAVGRVPLTGRIRRPLPGEHAELGDITLREAVPVDGRVVDEAGEPVEGARILFVQLDPRVDVRPAGVGTNVRLKTMLIATSDAQGQFAFDEPAFSGEWFIGAEYTGALIEPRNVRVTEDAAAFDLQIVVERPDMANAITGTVVDDLGRPVSGARAVLMGQGFIGRGLSDDDGNIVIHRAGPMPRYSGNKMNVDLDHESRLYEWPDPEELQSVGWGDRDVEFQLLRRASRAVRVVDSRGAPVEAYSLHAYSGEPGGYYSRYSQIDLRGRHPEGRCLLEGLYQGGQGLLVVPEDPTLGSTDLTTFTVEGVTPGPEQLVVVPDRSRCVIEVSDSAGTAVSGSTVELLQVLGPVPVDVATRAVPIADVDRSRSIERVLILAAGETDTRGRVEFAPPPGNFALRVRGVGHVDRVQDVAIAAGENRLAVTVETGAAARGRIGPEPVLSRLRQITEGYGLVVELRPTEKGASTVEMKVGDDGGFEQRGIPAGEYEARLRLEYEGGVYGTEKPVFTIAKRMLAEGATEEFDFDATACVPGRVTGRVLVDGEPLAGVHCFLRPVEEGGRGMIRVGTDEDGRFEALVKPGEFDLMTTMPAQPGPGWIRMPAYGRTWRVPPDGEARIDASIQLRRATLRFVDAEGEPLVDTLIDVYASAYGDPTEKRTDAEGRVRIDPAPPGEFRVRIGAGPDRKTIGPYSLPVGELESEMTIRVE